MYNCWAHSLHTKYQTYWRNIEVNKVTGSNVMAPRNTTSQNATDDSLRPYIPPDGAEDYFRNFIIGTLCAMAVLLLVLLYFQCIGGNYREYLHSFSENFQPDEWTHRRCRSRQLRRHRANDQPSVDDCGRVVKDDADADDESDHDEYSFNDGFSANLNNNFSIDSTRWTEAPSNR